MGATIGIEGLGNWGLGADSPGPAQSTPGDPNINMANQLLFSATQRSDPSVRPPLTMGQSTSPVPSAGLIPAISQGAIPSLRSSNSQIFSRSFPERGAYMGAGTTRALPSLNTTLPPPPPVSPASVQPGSFTGGAFPGPGFPAAGGTASQITGDIKLASAMPGSVQLPSPGGAPVASALMPGTGAAYQGGPPVALLAPQPNGIPAQTVPLSPLPPATIEQVGPPYRQVYPTKYLRGGGLGDYGSVKPMLGGLGMTAASSMMCGLGAAAGGGSHGGSSSGSSSSGSRSSGSASTAAAAVGSAKSAGTGAAVAAVASKNAGAVVMQGKVLNAQQLMKAKMGPQAVRSRFRAQLRGLGGLGGLGAPGDVTFNPGLPRTGLGTIWDYKNGAPEGGMLGALTPAQRLQFMRMNAHKKKLAGFSGLDGLGSLGVLGDLNCAQTADADGSYTTYCGCAFNGDAASIAKCNTQFDIIKALTVPGFSADPLMKSPPWTLIGATARGVPQGGAASGTTAAAAAAAAAPASHTWMWVAGGAAVLVLGGFVAFKPKRRRAA
jgi:hypothetical protein